MRIDDGGGGPTLDPKAKAHERELFRMFSFADYMVEWASADWKTSMDRLTTMSNDLKTMKTRLENGEDVAGSTGWTGPAAKAAAWSMTTLATNLEDRAAEMAAARTAMTDLTKAYAEARDQWYAQIASNTNDLKPASFTKTDPTTSHPVQDPAAYQAAVDAIYEQRNQAAKKILADLNASVQAASDGLPVEKTPTSTTPYTPTGGGGGGTGGHYATNTTIRSGPTTTTLTPTTGTTWTPEPTGPTVEPPTNPWPREPEICIHPGWEPETNGPNIHPEAPPPISIDGPSTYLPPTGGGGGGGGVGVPTPGGGGGGMAVGGGLGMLGGGGAFLTGGSRAGGSSSMAGQGSRGASGRGSSVRGATGTGKYGTPQVGQGRGTGSGRSGAAGAGGRSGGRGAGRSGTGRGTGAAGAAGRVGKGGRAGVAGAASGKSSGKGEREHDSSLDHLTHEDEETWFEGSDQAGPDVWR